MNQTTVSDNLGSDWTGFEEYCGPWTGLDESCPCPGPGPGPGFPVLGPVWTGTTLIA